MAGSTTGLPMSPWYGGYQTATPPPCFITRTYDMTSYCTEAPKYYTKAPGGYTTTYAALNCYTEYPQYYSSPSYTSKGSSTTPRLRITNTKVSEYYTTTTAAPAYFTEALKYYTTKAPEYCKTTYHGRERRKKSVEWASPTRHQELQCTICHQLRSSSHYWLSIMVNYFGVLLLGVVSLMAGSTTGASLSPGYGVYQTATLPLYYTTLYDKN